ncbi:MAG: hypothetical protein ACRDJP_08920 [Actinomycetota bacterium]
MRPRRLMVLAGLVAVALGFRKKKLDEADRRHAEKHDLTPG